MRSVVTWLSVLLFWALLAVAPVSGQQQRSQPAFVEVAPALHRFGEIPDRQPAVARFSVKNLAREILRVTSVRTGCGCTVTRWSGQEIEPGQSSQVEVSFDPRGRKGYLRWEIEVFTNLDKAPFLLCFDATVLLDGWLSDRAISFGEVHKGSRVEKMVWLSPREPAQFRLLDARIAPAKAFSVSWQETSYAGFYPGPRRAYCIRLVCTESMGYGPIHATLQLATDISDRQRIDIPVTGKICAEIAASRNYLAMGVVERGKSVRKEVTVYHVEDHKTFRILGVECDLAFAAVDCETVIDGRYYQVHVTVAPTPQQAIGEFRGELRVRTSSAEVPLLAIPLQGFVR